MPRKNTGEHVSANRELQPALWRDVDSSIAFDRALLHRWPRAAAVYCSKADYVHFKEGSVARADAIQIINSLVAFCEVSKTAVIFVEDLRQRVGRLRRKHYAA